MNTTGNPWSFIDTFSSPDGRYTLIYDKLGEVGMGAPLGGSCLLKINDRAYALKGTFGGPAVWNKTSNKIALPYWTKKRAQKLAIINMETMTLHISEKDFRVIELNTFEGGVVRGIDSPIYMTEDIVFNIREEAYEQEVDIQ